MKALVMMMASASLMAGCKENRETTTVTTNDTIVAPTDDSNGDETLPNAAAADCNAVFYVRMENLPQPIPDDYICGTEGEYYKVDNAKAGNVKDRIAWNKKYLHNIDFPKSHSLILSRHPQRNQTTVDAPYKDLEKSDILSRTGNIYTYDYLIQFVKETDGNITAKRLAESDYAGTEKGVFSIPFLLSVFAENDGDKLGVYIDEAKDAHLKIAKSGGFSYYNISDNPSAK